MKIAKIIFVLLVLAAVGIGFFMFTPKKEVDAKYRFDTISLGNIKQTVTANGTLNPLEIANVGAQVSGTVEKLYVDVNDEVEKGQLLAQIDPQILLASLKQIYSSLEISRINYEQSARDLKRTQQLFAKDYVAKVEVERAKQAYESARLSYESTKAQVERSEVELSYSKVMSPIKGVIISKEVTEGQTIASSFQAPTLFKIAGSLEDMKIDVTLPESDIGMVKQGMPVVFTVDAYQDKEFSGILDTINLNPNTGQMIVTYSATVLVKNPEKLLLPGMTAYVNITINEKADVLRAPAAALRFKPVEEKESGIKNLFNPAATQQRRFNTNNQTFNRKPTIYVLRNDKLVAVEVNVGMSDDNFVEILSNDIKDGDVVAVGVARAGS